jgi:hypothetical protein
MIDMDLIKSIRCCTLLFSVACASAFLTLYSLPATASAASCTNAYASGSTAPVGYGASWNPLTAARELLVQATDCTTSTANMQVGSGNAAQYVYNKGYYWTGSAWQQYALTGASTLQGNAWYTGSAEGTIPLSQSVTYGVGYVCQKQNGTWKCGFRDAACATSHWQLQRVTGASDGGGGGGGGDIGGGGSGTAVESGPQCADATPPPAAKEAGLTKLAFCDDFSSASTIDLGGTLKDGFKWYITGLPYGFKGSTKDAYHVSEGILNFNPTINQAQLSFISAVVPRGSSKPVGWYIDRETSGWYAESRISHSEKSVAQGFPAFWSLDMCHLYSYPEHCKLLVEPDFYEFISGGDTRAVHLHQDPTGTKASKVDTWGTYHPSDSNNVNWQKFNTVAIRVLPNRVNHYVNDAQVTNGTAQTKTKNGTFLWISDVVAGPKGLGTKVGRYPIIFGSGPGMPFKIDWVRVWVKP